MSGRAIGARAFEDVPTALREHLAARKCRVMSRSRARTSIRPRRSVGRGFASPALLPREATEGPPRDGELGGSQQDSATDITHELKQYVSKVSRGKCAVMNK